MDPITTASLIHDRTQELQRTADQLRQGRALRSTSPAETSAPPDAPTEAGRSPALSKAGTCAPAEPAI